ncbi:hypothetical protein HPP92_019270 [Vanilla planifolia]|uniref:1-phosphatidylinositol-4-phosphate 5-kinase n=1 Tax=Vanilla planifolia TaxID=51239 RepID=A0A835Q7A1_VANPL|nr:hypothetical protein HPP92_019270 [Vanilla planifolia]
MSHPVVERYYEKAFTNGDTYIGYFDGSLPHGHGKYIWSDGTTYEGDWENCKIAGKGCISWPSGSVYEGEFSGGFLHGTGTFSSPRGSIYKGSWMLNTQHGPGTKTYRNLDVYEGKMCGRGVMKWLNGDVFNGHWLDGLEHGLGYYYYSDGSCYVGTWSMGLKDGQGTYYPAGSRLPHRSPSNKSDFCLDWPTYLCPATVKSVGNRNKMLSVNKSVAGRCRIGNVFRHSGRISHRPSSSDGIFDFNDLFGSIRLKDNCVTLCSSDQDDRYTVGKITPVPVREVRSSDFGARARIRMYFPKKGSQFTPPHHSIDFHWKDYCPMVFRNLREMFKIDAADYMVSVCGGVGLKELSSPGKSGSIFYLSQDERFVIKTLRKNELKILLKMLPKYYEHVGVHDNTLITKFFGLHRITIKCGHKVLNLMKLFGFVVMGNMFCTELRIHQRYDLKGSSHGRSTEADKVNENTTLKDLDLSYVFHLEKSWRESLFRQLEEARRLEKRRLEIDCKILMIGGSICIIEAREHLFRELFNLLKRQGDTFQGACSGRMVNLGGKNALFIIDVVKQKLIRKNSIQWLKRWIDWQVTQPSPKE